jgi:hypothetical protein
MEEKIVPLLTPTKATLDRYGLSVAEWRLLADEQGEACFVCRQKPKRGRLCIDHEHVKNWKKMPPEHRKLFVRGLLCFRCNTTFVGRGVTIERSQQVVAYLQKYEARRVDPQTIQPKIRSKK